MRTTSTIEDKLAEALKSLAHRSGKPFKAVVNETLRAELRVKQVLPEPRAYTLEPHHLGKVRNDINLDKALALADLLEDEELVRKLRLKK